MKYFIQTFGCAANMADSQRISAALAARGMKLAKTMEAADYIVINSCIVRESAENRVYGLLNNLENRARGKRHGVKVVVTGCLVGMAVRDRTGKQLKRLKTLFPMVDEFLPIEEIGFDVLPLRTDKKHALVPISNGCNNFCTYCVVPFTRGREVSRPYQEIVDECLSLRRQGYEEITLLGQNVNSYGNDIVRGTGQRSKGKGQIEINGREIKPVMVKSMGRQRIPTLFPYLLEEVAQMGFEKVNFMSSNPWGFSPELIDVVARNKNINREIHLPVQSGDNEVLKRMNRWYTRDEYLALVESLKFKVQGLKLSTDIIVGFPGETKVQFENTVDLCKKVGFFKAYISEYSDRPVAAAHRIYKDDVTHVEKKRRWRVLEGLINNEFNKINQSNDQLQ